jgi:hypothetical protein
VQERGDDALFVKAPFSRKIQDVDPAKLAIGAVADQRFHGGNRLRISGLPYYAEQALGSSFAQWIPVPKSLQTRSDTSGFPATLEDSSRQPKATVIHTAFATVPDQRCTASLSLALHRIRDT